MNKERLTPVKRCRTLAWLILLLLPFRLWAQKPYAVFSEDNLKLTFYYDDQKAARGGMSVGPFNQYDARSWDFVGQFITTVEFDASFADCTTLTSTAYWFYGFGNLTEIIGLENLNTSNVTDMGMMFYYCSSLTSLDLSNFNTENVTMMAGMFSNCSSLTSLDVSHFNTENVTYMASMFEGCSSLTSLDVSHFNTANVKSMGLMFGVCSSLTSLDLSNFTTKNVTDMGGMFDGCSSLTSLDLSNFNTANVTHMGSMFNGCSKLSHIYVGNEWSTENITLGNYMFRYCSSLVGGSGTTYDANHTDYTYAHIDGGASNPGYFTEKNAPMVEKEPYAVLSENNTVLTFFYDDQKAARGGLSVGPFWYHWNDDKQEVEILGRDWDGTITKVIFDTSFADCTTLTSTTYWFFECGSLTEIIGLENLNTANVTDMTRMFYGCSSLTSLNVSNFNTANVWTMYQMFEGCSSLTSLDVSNFNTENVTDMSGMFHGCSGLTSLDLSNFNTANVTNMSEMFSRCKSLTSLEVSNFNTESVTRMSFLFRGCSDLTSLDVSNFNTASVTYMDAMFYDCSSLTSLDVSNFKTENVTSMRYMFEGCSSLASLDFSNFNTANVTNMNEMFRGCSSLTSLDVSNFNTENVTDMSSVFAGCSGLTSLDLSNFNTENVTYMGYMFYGCSSLTSLDLSNFNTENVTDMWYMFYGCSGLTSLDVSNFNTANVTVMWCMFSGCSGLTSLDVSNFNTAKVTFMGSMFYGCSGLTSLDLSNFNTENVTDMGSMFSGCSGLTSLDLSNFNTANVTDMMYMFTGCSSLTSLDLSNFNTANVTHMGGMFDGCSNLTSLDLSNFNTANVTDMMYMFTGCSSLTSLDLSNFNTANVTDMWYMFNGCSGLTSLDLSNFNTNNVTSMNYMFRSCFKLSTIYVGNEWSTASITEGNDMFLYCSSLVGGSGTTYDANHTDYTYAHIDGGASNPGYFTDKNGALTIALAYDGRVVTMTSEEGATIYYTLDGSEPTTASRRYSGDGLALTDLCTVKAFAAAEGKTPSALATLAVHSLFDGTTARVDADGSLAEAFQWCGGITNATNLGAIMWLRNDDFPADAASSVQNPNVLLYVNDYMQALGIAIRNVVADGLAQRITLTDNIREDGTRGPAAFYVPQAFRVQNDIKYTRTFAQQTVPHECRGWETIVLPFTVQTITHATNGECIPFAAYTAGLKPFWLCELTEQGFKDSDSLRANIPYIISMPENEEYSPYYRLAGEVTFSARGIEVPATQLQTSHRGQSSFVPCLGTVAQAEDVFALNVGEPRGAYAEGSLFDRNYRDVYPFEAYRTTTQAGVRYISIADDFDSNTAIMEMRDERMRSEKQSGAVYDLRGLRVKTPRKGLYIRQGKKVVVVN